MKKLYLVAAARSHRIVAWHAKQPERDSVLTEINRGAPGQYIAGEVEIDGVNVSYRPADLVVPDQFRQEFRAAVDALAPVGSQKRWS